MLSKSNKAVVTVESLILCALETLPFAALYILRLIMTLKLFSHSFMISDFISPGQAGM